MNINWENISIVLNILLAFFGIWQYQKSRGQEEKLKSQVKVWMQDANGIQEALQKIVNDNIQKRYSTTDDVCNAVWAIKSSAFALYQSLYEERCVTEEEYKEQQSEIAAVLRDKQLKQLQKEQV